MKIYLFIYFLLFVTNQIWYAVVYVSGDGQYFWQLRCEYKLLHVIIFMRQNKLGIEML